MSNKNKIYISFAVIFPLILAIFLQFLPLTNTTGYEFALILTIPLYLSGGLLYFVSNNSTPIWKYILAAVTLPLLVSIFSNIFYSDCPLSIDAFFYPILSVPAFFVGCFTSEIINALTNKFRIGVLIISLIVLLLIALLEFYFRPQIYFYNIVFGYFPGTMYDENISITLQLIIYRLISLTFVIILAKAFTSVGKRHRAIVLLTTIILGVVWLWLLKPGLSFSTSNNTIQSELSLELKTDHFQIFIDPDINYDTTSLKLMHEFYYTEVSNSLDVTMSSKITSYIFKDKRQKKRLFGSENADVAKPWLKQIYLDESSFKGTLEHEIVHILAGEFGNPPFYVAKNINPALIEGLAMAIENNFDNTDIDYITSLALANNYDLKISELFDGFNFLGNLSSLSYIFSGSFINYLNTEYGIDKLRKVYRTADFDKVYGKRLEQLEAEFLTYIASKHYQFNSAQAQLYFGRASLVNKICPRLAARIENDAWGLYREEKFDDALEKFQFVFNSVGTYSSLNGIILTNVQLKKYAESLRLAKEKLTTFSNTSYFYSLILRVADLSVLNSDSIEARNSLTRLQKLNPSNYYYNETVLRRQLLSDGIEEYESYLLSPTAEKYSILVKYLNSKNNFASIIPKLIEYRIQLKMEDDNFVSLLNELIFDVSREEVLAAVQLSQYFYGTGDYELAVYYSDLAVKNNSNIEYQPILEKQYNLVSWSIERNTN